MLIKIRDFSDETASQLMLALGEKTGAKAVGRAAEGYLEATKNLLIASDHIEEMSQTIARQARIIENARASAAALLDKTSQGDLLASDPADPPSTVNQG